MGAESPASGGHWGSGGETQPPEDGGLGQSSQPPEAREPLGDFCNFSIKITHFIHISAKIVISKQ